MEKIKRFVLLFIVAMLSFTPFTSHATDVTITLPSFPVVLNGTKMNNDYSQYPLIVYKNITYFPMTYYDCQFLGLKTDWTQEEGLKITKTANSWNYKFYEAPAKNRSSYRASIANLPVKVNSEVINNSKEPYPLLTFRDVTYFPLTWRFAVDSFSWKYNFTSADGLSIYSNQIEDTKQSNSKVVTLPLAEFGEREPFRGDFVKLGSYIYYHGKGNIIYQALASNPSERKEVFKLESMAEEYGNETRVHFYVRNNKAFVSYRSGGGVMGHDNTIYLKEDGTYEELNISKYYEFPSLAVGLDDRGHLCVRAKGSADFTQLNSFYYQLSNNANPRKGDELYVLAGNDSEEYNGMSSDGVSRLNFNKLFKINCKTGDMVKLSDLPITVYDLSKDTIYFNNVLNNGLYKMSIDGGEVKKVSDHNVDKIAVLNNHVFYITQQDRLLYQLGKETSLNSQSVTESIEVKDGYLYATFSSGAYKFMVFNQNGDVVEKTTENVKGIYIENGNAVYVKGDE